MSPKLLSRLEDSSQSTLDKWVKCMSMDIPPDAWLDPLADRKKISRMGVQACDGLIFEDSCNT